VGICTIQCADDRVCKPADACLNVSGVNVCVPSDSGRPCPTGQPTNCLAGICLVHPGNVSLSECATPCSSARACPAGFSCSTVQVGATPQTVCTRVGTACTAQGLSTQCITRWCSTQAQNPSDGVCTNVCRDALDCPSGWACGLDDDGLGGVIDVCQPVGGACTEDTNGNNDCYSKNCSITSGNSGYCTALCMNGFLQQESARCPSGWACNAVPVGMDTWYACESP